MRQRRWRWRSWKTLVPGHGLILMVRGLLERQGSIRGKWSSRCFLAPVTELWQHLALIGGPYIKPNRTLYPYSPLIIHYTLACPTLTSSTCFPSEEAANFESGGSDRLGSSGELSISGRLRSWGRLAPVLKFERARQTTRLFQEPEPQ